MAGLCPACGARSPRNGFRQDRKGDPVAPAFGFELVKLGARVSRALAVPANLALVMTKFAGNAPRLTEQFGGAIGHQTARACWKIRRPNRSLSLAAAACSSAVNCIARPAGVALRYCGAGLPD